MCKERYAQIFIFLTLQLKQTHSMKIFFVLIFFLSIFLGCSKNETLECGTVVDISWTKEVTTEKLSGEWIMLKVYYRKGMGSSYLYDTCYNLNIPLSLYSDGTGVLRSMPIRWSISQSDSIRLPKFRFPKLTLSQVDSLFPFQANFFQNSEIDIFLQMPPETRFYGRTSVRGNDPSLLWEYADISFERR